MKTCFDEGTLVLGSCTIVETVLDSLVLMFVRDIAVFSFRFIWVIPKAVLKDTSIFVQFYCTLIKGKNKVLVILVENKTL